MGDAQWQTPKSKVTAPLDCQDGCSWVAHVIDGVVTKVSGAKDHPFTRGVLCAKVNDYRARTYAPDRLLHPLCRSGAKRSGIFQQISWDDAIAAICLVPHVTSAIMLYDCDLKRFPAAHRVYEACMDLPEFAEAHPKRQPDAHPL